MVGLDRNYELLDSWQQAPGSRQGLLLVLFASAGVASLAIFYLLNTGSIPLGICLAAAFAAVCWATTYTSCHREWVPCMLILIELIPSTTLFDDNVRPILRYMLYSLFCIPLAPLAWRSGLLGRGGFRDYVVYFGWALVTVTYSLSPLYSLGRLLIASAIFLSFVAIISEVNDEEGALRLFKYTIFGGAAMMAITGIATAVLPRDFTWAQSLDDPFGIPRFRGLFDAPATMGELMLPITLSAFVCWRSAGKLRWILVLLIASSLYVAGLSDSRSPFLGIAAGGAAYLVWKRGVKGALILCGMGVIIFALFSMINPEYVFRQTGTLTGRTDIWRFELSRIAARPFLGYGYEVEGEIFNSRYFPVWWGPFDFGPRSSLHNSHLSRAVGIGLPFTLFWLFFSLRPWVALFRQREDPWNLKPVALLVVLPLLVRSLVESDVSDGSVPAGAMVMMAWALAERARLNTLPEAIRDPSRARGVSSGFAAPLWRLPRADSP
jgi:O-antigen ligase/polysaccharide polymerase Wzy-like membrane protein